MKWNFDNDNFQSENNDEFDKLCPVCKQRLLEAKLEKIKEMNQYQQTQYDILLIEEIKKELEKIKREQETQLYVYFCRKHKNENIL
ncbi:hypothetical protein [Spiroplasma endosymbiont of Polydrusus pterygomalis]|uniref:hypothetical protein n=1 Tax=Spiroplasma endosymbiont of Polydrusus pterygomalis TaxID=3139327 RepID=UPI003CCAB1AA